MTGQPRQKKRKGPEIRRSVLAGAAIVALFFGGIGSWAVIAPLSSAAIAHGVVSVDSQHKTIKHLEGGIIRDILARDGDAVRPGQKLIRLDRTRAKATLDLLKARRIAAAALEARLRAEQAGRAEISFPGWLRAARNDPAVADALEGQLNIFRARQQAVDGRIAIQEQRIAQLREEITGLKGQIRAENAQLQLIEDEMFNVADLVAKGLARRPRLLALQRGMAEIEGSRSRNRAAIARAGQRIGEARIRISDLKTEMLNDVVVQLRDTQGRLFDLAERIRAAEDVLSRTEIRAPIAGTIVGLKVHTQGGVIGAGEALMSIVPTNDQLVIEARVDPNDIDVVHSGLEAQVRFSALNARHNLPITGTVISVSADRLTDDRSGRPYYLARVRLPANAAASLDGAELHPGMPAEVMIVTGARTALDYLLKPISTSLNRAFREE